MKRQLPSSSLFHLNVAHKFYSEESFAKDQRGANAVIYENHIRSEEPHESVNPASNKLAGNCASWSEMDSWL